MEFAIYSCITGARITGIGYCKTLEDAERYAETLSWYDEDYYVDADCYTY